MIEVYSVQLGVDQKICHVCQINASFLNNLLVMLKCSDPLIHHLN